MNRVAVFVDAGYFFAQGSAAIWGEKQRRTTLDLDEAETIKQITSLANSAAPNATLLRIYWYDGAGPKGPTLEQLRLARQDNIKIRLGFINSIGQQKGVDSLIVTDLVDLARNRAMSDAILLSGDEDVRIDRPNSWMRQTRRLNGIPQQCRKCCRSERRPYLPLRLPQQRLGLLYLIPEMPNWISTSIPSSPT
jgi:hypothetical protein